MAGLVLFARGKEFDAESFLKESPWRSFVSAPHLQFNISDPDDNVKSQLQKAIVFLRRYDREFERLRNFDGLEEIELRFGAWWFEDSAALVFSMPPELVSPAGRHGIEITVCVYATDKSSHSKNTLTAKE